MAPGMRVAVTGHRDLSSSTSELVDAAFRAELAAHAPGLVGVSCLAPGADQIFAEAVLDLGGAIEAIVPAHRYDRVLTPGDRAAFDRLLRRARIVVRLPYEHPTPASYQAANETLLRDVHLLLAVWDGEPAQGRGGTAEVVSDARRRSIEVRVLWPEGASRTGHP